MDGVDLGGLWHRYWGSQEWTRELGYEVIKDWRPWSASLDGSTDPESAQRAGYAIDYGNNTGFKCTHHPHCERAAPRFLPSPGLRGLGVGVCVQM